MTTTKQWHYFSSGPREAVLQRLIHDDIKIAAVYVTDPEKWPKVKPTVILAEKLGLPVTVLRRQNLSEPSAELRNAACLSVGFGFIFPAAFLRHVGPCLNVHGTLLPDYPGARSLNWVIANGEKQSGVTVHMIDQGVDTGPIILQESFSLSPFETGTSLVQKTREFEPQVVVKALRLFTEKGATGARQQGFSGKRFADRKPEHSEIDPNRPLIELVNDIRAADPENYPAYFYLHGQKVCIRLWRPDRPSDEKGLL